MARTRQTPPIPKKRPVQASDPVSTHQSNAAQIEQMKTATADEGYLPVASETPMPPVFKGFEDDKYQLHDPLIQKLVGEFNLDKSGFIGANPNQTEGMSDLDPALVKAWALQETGGGGEPWAKDPIQANNPGDWDPVKKTLGLQKPDGPNTGDAETNMRASIALLARKGFSRSGKPPSVLRGGQTFGGWEGALRNYNGNNRKIGGRRHKDVYTERILNRANNPDLEHRIPLGKPPR